MSGKKFSVNDKVAYPGQGVAEIIAINEKKLGGQTLTFYELKMLETGIKIMVPINKALQVGLRNLVTDEEIQEIFNILKDKNVVFDNQAWNRRYRGFVEKIKTGSLFDVAEVFRDLSLLKNQKTLSFGEKRMLETAISLMVKELSIVQDKSEEETIELLESFFK